MAKAHTLTDNFNDNTADTAKWTVYGNPAPASERIREVNGRIELRPQSGGGSTHYSGYYSASAYDLTSSEASIEVVRALRRGDGVQTFFSAEIDENNKVYFEIDEGELSALQRVTGAYTRLRTVPYDSATHRWLRLREDSGTTFWEYSADGADWSVLTQKSNPINLSAVYFELGAGTPSTSSPGMAIFDNFNFGDTSPSRQVEERRLSARDLRVEAADLAAARPHLEHVNNNDEVNYATTPLVGNYSKSLKHDSLGDPDPASYGTLLRALQSQDPADFEEIQLASNTAIKLTNPQSGLAAPEQVL